MKVEITNRQVFKKINIKKISSLIKKAGMLLGISSQKISFCLCDNTFIADLNKKYFQKNTPTDVIAFPLSGLQEDDYLGEVVASVEQAILTAQELDLYWQDELLLYLIHGILHLIGYDDSSPAQSGKMRVKQQQTLAAVLNNLSAQRF